MGSKKCRANQLYFLFSERMSEIRRKITHPLTCFDLPGFLFGSCRQWSWSNDVVRTHLKEDPLLIKSQSLRVLQLHFWVHREKPITGNSYLSSGRPRFCHKELMRTSLMESKPKPGRNLMNILKWRFSVLIFPRV